MLIIDQEFKNCLCLCVCEGKTIFYFFQILLPGFQKHLLGTLLLVLS
jgi:hypothetical protein